MKYEIRRDGVTVAGSETLARCGYSAAVLRGMVAEGYRYYEDGKLVRKIEGDGKNVHR